jgi:hypothetical protein
MAVEGLSLADNVLTVASDVVDDRKALPRLRSAHQEKRPGQTVSIVWLP